MSEEGPKLYSKTPKKAQLKQFQQQQQSKPKNFSSPLASSAASMATQSSSTPPPPPPPPKESFARRYKFVWPLLLTANLAVGAYLFMRTKKKDIGVEEEISEIVSSAPVSTPAATTAPVTKEPVPSPHVMEPVKKLEPIPESQQRELFKWILEEKRKAKPKDPEEKKRIDEEKAILKQFIRAKSIPSI